MAPTFLSLPREERAAILAKGASELNKSAQVLEKDVWVCWALAQLFKMPERLRMAFKGGTSLSKVHNAIARFSEDVDITLDHRQLVTGCDPFDPDLSGNQRKKLREALEEAVKGHIEHAVIPHLKKQLAGEDLDARLELVGKESVRVHYETAVDDGDEYLADSVLLEFGGRNPIQPSDSIPICPYLCSLKTSEELDFPVANVEVLSAQRTFWEKATLIHVECTRAPRNTISRLSRHWYDVAKLADHDIGRRSIENRALLEEVVACKSVLFAVPGTDYNKCLRGEMVLVPPEPVFGRLRADFDAMVGSGMFIGDAPKFSEIMDRIEGLENHINTAMKQPRTD